MLRLSRRLLLVSALALTPSCDTPQKHALRELSRAGVQPSGRALVEAVTDGENPHVRWLLDVKVHTEQRDATGYTPLRIAVGQDSPSVAIVTGNPNTVRELLAAGADPNEPVTRPVSQAFLDRVKSKHMRWYLTRDRNITPIMLAANTGNLATARRLPRLHPPPHGLRQKTLRHDQSRRHRYHQTIADSERKRLAKSRNDFGLRKVRANDP